MEKVNNIKMYRQKKGLSQKQLAMELEVSQPTASAWENGTKLPSSENLLKLALLLDTSVEHLLGVTYLPDNPNKVYGSNEEILRIPVFGTIPAGLPLEAIEDILDIEEAPASWTKGGQEYFALKIKGDSMSPKYLSGDVIIFRKTPSCENGQDCCVMVNGDEATFKKVFISENGITLQPLNSEYPPMFYSNKDILSMPVTILGVVKELRRAL